ncbi:MAG: GNAT family N-acetyltransferase [Polyangiaceae bacterium]|nr:GNAT family N-acetyltransferase [Polyangiaceae bacterium]
MNPLTTARLRLIPASAALLDADRTLQVHGSDQALRVLLNIGPIGEWPPIGSDHNVGAVDFFRANTPDGSQGSEWGMYYACFGQELVGSVGFLGPPANGDVEIGYSICLMQRRRGLAMEVVQALVEKARTRGVARVKARTPPDNQPSIALLLKAGFLEQSPEDEHLLFIKTT